MKWLNFTQATRGNIATPFKSSKDKQEELMKIALFNQKQSQLEEAQKQQQFANNLATQANARQQWQAEARGMGQGQLVADALKNVTSKTNALDNTNTMEALNKTFTQAGTDDKLAELVGKLDSSESYNEAVKGIFGNKELTPEQATAAEEAVKQGVLGKDYGLYKKLYDTAGANIETLNKDAGSADYPWLYKTTDANAAKSALYNQLVNGGVNPVYADKVATDKSSQYVMTAPKAADAQKEQLTTFRNIQKAALKKVKSTTDSVSTGGNDGTKKTSIDMRKKPDALKVGKLVDSALTTFGVGDSLAPWHNDKSQKVKYMQAAVKPVIPVDAKGNPLVDKNGKPYPPVYATPSDISNVVLSGVENHWFTETDADNIDTFRKKLAMHAGSTIVDNGGIYSGSRGSNTKVTSSSTLKSLTPEAQKEYLDAVAGEQALLNSLRNPTGQEIADRIAGTKNGKRADVVDLSSLYSKSTTSTKTQEKKKTDSKPETSALLAAFNSPKGNHAVTNMAVNNPKLFASLYGELDAKQQRRVNKAVENDSAWLNNTAKGTKKVMSKSTIKPYRPGTLVDEYPNALSFYIAKGKYDKAHPKHIVPNGEDVENFLKKLMSDKLPENTPTKNQLRNIRALQQNKSIDLTNNLLGPTGRRNLK